jgi:hypothetical protein
MLAQLREGRLKQFRSRIGPNTAEMWNHALPDDDKVVLELTTGRPPTDA